MTPSWRARAGYGLVVLAMVVAAGWRGGSAAQQMPDPSQMAGRPLPAPELPVGTVSVRLVRERMGNNIASHPVTLEVASQPRTATTDAQGRAQFEGIPAGTSVVASATVDGEVLRSEAFPVPATGGVRVALVAGLAEARSRERLEAEAAAKAPARAGVVVFGGESRIIFEFQDDNLQVFYLLDVVNGARTPIDVGQPLILELPEGASGAGAMQGSSTLASAQGDRIRITGPFPPGTTSIQVGFRLAYSGDRTTIVQRWPAALEQVFVAVEKIGAMRVESPQFTGQQEGQAGNAPFLMGSGGRINAGDALTLTLSGLPHRTNTVRNVGVGAGAVILVLGLIAAFRGPPPVPSQAAQLERRREKLFGDLVELEEQHQRGRVEAGRYATRRQGLVAQLERVWGELDRASAARP
ncbi:MAG: hypothetical protein ACT4QD_26075 [Acidobacteriota bacterium]